MPMRTQDEIVARFMLRKDLDLLGFETGEYLLALDFEHAKPFIDPRATPERWKDVIFSGDESVLERMRSYVDFAYEKINDERGISAVRSISHYIAWLWLVGNDALCNWVESAEYTDYGRAIMDRICAEYGWTPTRPNEPSEYHGPAHHELMPDVYASFLKGSGKPDDEATRLEFNKTAERFASGNMVLMGATKK
jgi:hypothetical protein